MMQTREQPLSIHPTSWHDRYHHPRIRVARCLFGRPAPGELKKLLEEELMKQVMLFASRYEICEPLPAARSPASGSALERLSPDPAVCNTKTPVRSEDSPRKRRAEEVQYRQKKQRLLTDYWSKTKDSFVTNCK